MRAINQLTTRGVAAIKEPGRHPDGLGLYLVVDPRGDTKKWVFRFRWHGKVRDLGIGSAATVSLADARDQAKLAREAMKRGVNPIELRAQERAARTVHTFGALADQLVRDMAPQWKSEVHRKQWLTTLTVDAAALRPLPASSITTDDVLRVLRPIWETKPETASRLRGRIERVLDAAKVKGLRTGENPARWKGHLELLLPKQQAHTRGHHAAMPYTEVAAFMRDLRARQGLSYRALEFTILTAARTGEVLKSRAREFDLLANLWTRPAEHMKAKKPHVVTLSAGAANIVAGLVRNEPSDGLVFPLAKKAMQQALDRLDRSQYTVHGFRSTFKDWASDKTDFQNEVSEMALAHAVGSKVEQAYRRGAGLEKRFELMNAWENWCAAP